MHKLNSLIIIIVILTSFLALNPQPIRADLNLPLTSYPSAEYLDLRNGTKIMIIDYGNGTQDTITETFTRKNASLQIPNNSSEQILMTTSQSQPGSASNYSRITQTFITEQEVLLGFTYRLSYNRRLIDMDITLAYVRIGINVDIGVGLRLPINISIEYPRKMISGNNYTIYSAVTSIDKLDFEELLLVFKCYIWVDAGIWVYSFPFGHMETYYATWGPNYDLSKSFETPFGAGVTAPFPQINFEFFDAIWIIPFSLVKAYLTLTPNFGSEKITAKASCVGDGRIAEGENLTWSYPGQNLNFTVAAEDVNNASDYLEIKIFDIRYYFTILNIDVGILLKFHDWISWLTGHPSITLGTLDLSWLIEKFGNPYLSVHQGFPRIVYVTIFVEGVIPPTEILVPRDITVLDAQLSANTICPGQNINITMIIGNLGLPTETLNATVHCNNDTIAEKINIRLCRGKFIVLTFTWDTKDLAIYSSYNIWVEISILPNEINVDDNMLPAGVIETKALGDINSDGKIDVFDIIMASTSFGAKEGEFNWNADADLAPLFGIIDLYDIVTIAYHYGETYIP